MNKLSPFARTIVLLIFFLPCADLFGQKIEKFSQEDKFRQLEEILPTPNDYRTASGAPGRDYWQQRVDYLIDVEIDDDKQKLIGSEIITYTNRSPDPLRYIWLQLDPNIRQPHSDANLTRTQPNLDRLSYRGLEGMMAARDFEGGVKISKVADAQSGDDLKFTIVKTMMRIDLPEELSNGDSYDVQVDWTYAINNSKKVRGRTGYEYFEKDDNYLYEMAQWYPRAVAYTDVNGWQHKQFLGRGEFTLDFGDYVVRITVPDDHVVASTGVLQNSDEVLNETQQERLKEAAQAEKPMFIITPEEALENESSEPGGKKTWVFKAEKVRDFAFASSRKYIWDAMNYETREGNDVLCMSFYPKEGEPLWSRYSTHAVAHTLDVYGKVAFPYPYPVAISVNGPVGGMEYPMICFNGPRPEEDGTYSARTKYGLISVIIHEVGHNWYPMIVNSDERQWTWMDEGLNTFVQTLAEAEWEEDYPTRRGIARSIRDYMKSENQVPIMTNSESILQFGNNAYAKPAAALSVLRETVMGRELFDFAFKEYSVRWKFKRPQPADFFRSMEDASAVDLDWFWRGWFYSTDHVDLSLRGVRKISLDTGNSYIEKPKDREERDAQPETVQDQRNAELEKRTARFPELKDFYNQYDELEITEDDRQAYERFINNLSDEQKEVLGDSALMYAVDIENIGGLVMPVVIQIEYTDDSTEVRRFPSEIWRQNNEQITKLLVVEKPIKQLSIDPLWETADIDVTNNFFPRRIEDEDVGISNFDPRRGGSLDRRSNPMQEALERAMKEKEEEQDEENESEEKEQDENSDQE